MGIQFAVHTYGYSDAMFFVLNGIKMIMDSSFTAGMIQLMGLIATSYYALLGMSGASEGRAGTYFLKTAGMLLIITSLLTPKADILVIDRITGQKERVTNLPYAFVLPVGILEAVGAGMTSMFEQVFAPVSSAPYKDYGMIFGQRMVLEARNWKISNPEFSRNMDVFIKRCVVLEAMIGSRFTPEDVKSSNNLIKLVTDNAGTFRKVDFRIKGRPSKLTCRAAGAELKKYFGSEMGFLNFKYKKRDFALASGNQRIVLDADVERDQLNAVLARNIEIGYKGALGVAGNAQDIVRQNMMINALKGFNNKSDLYGYTRAANMQASNWKIAGELAKEYLPLLLNIIKALVYASFIFLVPLMILGGGIGKYLKYCVVVFSLQIWPALNSVLNLFIELYSNTKGSGITGGIITYGNFDEAHQAVDIITLVASGLQMSIPFLSIAIVQGSVGAFTHLSGMIQSASSGAASMAAGELTSGNRSFDNISQGGESYDQKSGFKTDFNQSYQAGARQVQGASGAMWRGQADGSSSITSGGGVNLSSGSRKFSLEQSTQSGLQQNLNKGISALTGEEQNYQKAKSATTSSTADLVSHLAQRENAGQTFNYEKMGEEGQALQKAVNHTKDLHDQNSYDWHQAAGVSVRAYADVGAKTPESLPILKASAGIAMDGTLSANNTSNQSLNKGEGISRSNDTHESFNNLARAAQNSSWQKENSIDTSFAESTRANYDDMQHYQQSVSQRKEEVDNYSSALHASQTSGASDNRDMYHEVEQGVMQQYGVSQEQAHQMVEHNDARANKVWDGIVQSNIGGMVAKGRGGQEYVNNIANQNNVGFHNEHNDKINKQGVQDLKQTATNQGLDKRIMDNDLYIQEASLKAQHTKMRHNNQDQILDNSFENEKIEKTLQARAVKYEEDRIGQGIVAKTLNSASNSGLIDVGKNIGGPNKGDK